MLSQQIFCPSLFSMKQCTVLPAIPIVCQFCMRKTFVFNKYNSSLVLVEFRHGRLNATKRFHFSIFEIRSSLKNLTQLPKHSQTHGYMLCIYLGAYRSMPYMHLFSTHKILNQCKKVEKIKYFELHVYNYKIYLNKLLFHFIMKLFCGNNFSVCWKYVHICHRAIRT